MNSAKCMSGEEKFNLLKSMHQLTFFAKLPIEIVFQRSILHEW
jgi:hypothetical protein